MISDLPLDLIKASQNVLNVSPLEECTSCGAVVGTCIHTDPIAEDVLSAMDIPAEDSTPDELSGKQEEVIINPEYQPNLGMRNRF
jgi:hypothetical protein